MKDTFRFKVLAAGCVTLLLIGGCGSSSDSAAPPPQVDTMAQEDSAASSSVAGFIAFIQAMIASMTLELNEPRNIGGITPPATETAEPTAI